jgi:diguanylate cyclase (GGDEF)-like protein
VQVTSVVVITLFFLLLARSVRRAELRPWVRSSVANLAALAVANLFWFWQPAGAALVLVRALYIGLKTASLLLLVQGAWAFVRPGARLLRPLPTWTAVAVAAALGGVLLDAIPKIGIAQQGFMTFVVGGAGVALLRARDRTLIWLTTGLFIRALLAAVETAAYVTQTMPPESVGPDLSRRIAIFLASHSSFDSGGEWLLALGCVIALFSRIQREMQVTNDELLAAQDDLRRLADRDALTALANRRALPAAFRAAHDTGAALLFFDLNDFKGINDALGHAAGDACLARFADGLRDCFRPGDTLVRYAGDEFLVVAGGLGLAQAHERVYRLRALLAVPRADVPPVGFSVGVVLLEPGGEPDEALRAADGAMYEAKRAKASR